MKRENLTPEGQEKYDEIVREIKIKLNVSPPIPQSILSSELGNKPYQDIAKEYISKLNSLYEKYGK
ncbi:MAG: hypothetical protein J1F42_01690 [Lachnospiraceae bacterium]|nr:hypothetical protein [Lachnospiraceae bacterium]